MGGEVAEQARAIALEVYEAGAARAEANGIIIADTKFELGFVDGELVLADEVLTPDSSRFWPADEWKPGITPPVVRQAAAPRLARGPGWDKRATASSPACGGGRGESCPLRRGLRAHHRPAPSPTGPVAPSTYDTVSTMRFSVLVEVRLRPGVADPQGATIERALPTLGFDGVREVPVGKAIRFELDAADEAAARKRGRRPLRDAS